MKRTLRIIPVLVILLASTPGFSQTAFFKSKQEFTSDQLEKFHSSVTIEGDLILFLANDYKLYAYDRSTGKELWATPVGYKSKRPCFVAEGKVFTPYYSEKQERTAMLDAVTGKLIRILGFGLLETKPIMKEGILFGTAIYDGGAIFAYDTKRDSTIWWKFLAHGVSTQPYYFSNYIQANAEANNWVRISYKGQLLDTTCKEKADIFVSDIPCIRIFNVLTHDGLELDAKFSEKLLGDNEAITTGNTLTGSHNSFILHVDELVILGNKRKILERIDLPALLKDTIKTNYAGLTQLLWSTNETISFVYNDMMVTYDHTKKKIIQMIDLSTWQPTQVLQDKHDLWLISKKDGLLYGLSF